MFRLKPAFAQDHAEASAVSDRLLDRLDTGLAGCGINLSCRHLILAVSGGPDSMAMASLIHRWAQKTGIPKSVRAIIVDHGIRAESKTEAEDVLQSLITMGIKADIATVRAPAPESGKQAWARQERYALIAAEARKDNAVLMVAHHAHDQAETIAMRLQAGSGLAGLRGMEPISRFEDMTVIRPFLDWPPQALHEILARDKIPFVEDPSNHNEDFERIAIRTRMDAFAREGVSASSLAHLGELSGRLHDHCLKAASQKMDGKIGQVKAGAIWIDYERLCALPELASILYLRDIMRKTVPSRLPISVEQMKTLLKRLADKKKDGVAATLGGCEWTRKGRLLWIYPEAEQACPSVERQEGSILFDQRWRVEGSLSGKISAMGSQRAADFRRQYPEIVQDWAGLSYEGGEHMMPMRGLWRLPIVTTASFRQDLSCVDGLLALEDGAIIPHLINKDKSKISENAPITMRLIKTLSLGLDF